MKEGRVYVGERHINVCCHWGRGSPSGGLLPWGERGGGEAAGGGPITEDRRLILLERWLRGLTRSLCFAAELSRQEEDPGGQLKSATGATLLAAVRGQAGPSLGGLEEGWSGEGGREEETKETFTREGANGMLILNTNGCGKHSDFVLSPPRLPPSLNREG